MRERDEGDRLTLSMEGNLSCQGYIIKATRSLSSLIGEYLTAADRSINCAHNMGLKIMIILV
jgi:hypothetical protein